MSKRTDGLLDQESKILSLAAKFNGRAIDPKNIAKIVRICGVTEKTVRQVLRRKSRKACSAKPGTETRRRSRHYLCH